MLRTRSPRISWHASVITLAAPWAAWLTFPLGWVFGYSWVYRLIVPFAPSDSTWSEVGRGCFGQPLGQPGQRAYQLFIDIGQGEFVFLTLMGALTLVAIGSNVVDVHRTQTTSALPTLTLCMCMLSVLTMTGFMRAALLSQI